VVEVGNGRGHCWLKSLHLRQNLRKNITILRDFNQFVDFPPLLFLNSYGTEQWLPTADMHNKQHKKKQWKKGH